MPSETMNVDRINELLERYYDARTTEAEEQELKQFFACGEVPDHLLTEKAMFMQMQAMADTPIPQGLEERISQNIDAWEAEEPRMPKIQRKANILSLPWIGSIAASMLILLSIGWYLYEPQPVRKDTCTTPEEAYMHAQKALAMFSHTLNKGMEQMNAAHAASERIERTLQKQFNKIND